MVQMTQTIPEALAVSDEPRLAVGSTVAYRQLAETDLRDAVALAEFDDDLRCRDPHLEFHRTVIHRVAQPGCPWCPQVACRCGGGCVDPQVMAEHSRTYGMAEASWREPLRPVLAEEVARG